VLLTLCIVIGKNAILAQSGAHDKLLVCSPNLSCIIEYQAHLPGQYIRYPKSEAFDDSGVPSLTTLQNRIFSMPLEMTHKTGD
jgi:hypothetical protein